MGAAALYFYSVNEDNGTTLHDRIKPSQIQMDEQQLRWHELAEFLLPNLEKATGYPTRSWLQGSYKFHTQIRPVRSTGEFDIDLGLYCVWDPDDVTSPPSPLELKDFVQNALIKYATDSEGVAGVLDPPKTRCSRISFQGAFHIDCPIYHLDEDADQRLLATQEDEWEVSDPKKLYTWFRDLFDQNTSPKVRRIIRYLKVWANLKFTDDEERPSSTLLTVLVAQAASPIRNRLPNAEDETFTVLVSELLKMVRRGKSVPHPIHDENLAASISDHGWKLFIERLSLLEEAALRACDQKTTTEACCEWSQIFEHLIPMPSEEVIKSEAKHFHVQFRPLIVEVTARRQEDSFTVAIETNAIGPIPKGCMLDFRVTNASSFPQGTRFDWIARNNGFEASQKNDLGHTSGTGFSAKERSAYNGRHYMDCTAFYDGNVIGLRRVRVDIYSDEKLAT